MLADAPEIEVVLVETFGNPVRLEQKGQEKSRWFQLR
jgi:hypothetical protein